MPTITCPHCGASRNPPLEKLPKRKVRACCPECGKGFRFDPVSILAPAAVGSFPPGANPDRPAPINRRPCLAAALLAALLIPALFLLVQRQSFSGLTVAADGADGAKGRGGSLAGRGFLLDDLFQDLSPVASLAPPEELTAADYDRLLREGSFPTDQQGVALGPAVLTAQRFWIDERNPHLWLAVRLINLPNLALSGRRSARVQIEKVLDIEQHDQYNRRHSFETTPFEWIDIRSDPAETGFSGIRNVYLKQGARPEQISSISGRLELTLPLGIKSLQFNRQDVGKEFSVAGKTLKLETFGSDRLSLSFPGELPQILSIRAYNRQAEPLREEGEAWQNDGRRINLQQMFNGRIDAVTVLVATATLTRSYPFEITR
jgi:hypothetical protein